MPITKWYQERVVQKALDAAEVRIAKACAVVQRNIKTALNRPGGRGSVVSSPGESPRKQSGRLYGSIFFSVVREQKEIVGVIYSNDPKARRLELGFVGRDKLGRLYDQAPRPFMRPGLANSQDQIKRILGGRS